MKFFKNLSVLSLCISLCAMALPASLQAASPPTRHTVTVAGHSLAVWSRVPPKPQHALLLLHGRTWSSLPDFDLQVKTFNRSVMQALAERGLAVYALDLRGYGATPRNANGWNTPNEAAADVAQTLKWIAQRHASLDKPALFGWSMGSMIAHLTAQQHPELLSDLILYGYPRDPAAVPTMPPTPDQPPREVNTVERAASDFISPEVTPRAVIDAYVAAALKADPVRADWRGQEQYLALDPAKIKTPTLLIHGERDPLAPVAAQARVFVALGHPDKQWVILPGGDHAAMIENTHEAFIAAVESFVKRPKLHACDCKKIEGR